MCVHCVWCEPPLAPGSRVHALHCAVRPASGLSARMLAKWSACQQARMGSLLQFSTRVALGRSLLQRDLSCCPGAYEAISPSSPGSFLSRSCTASCTQDKRAQQQSASVYWKESGRWNGSGHGVAAGNWAARRQAMGRLEGRCPPHMPQHLPSSGVPPP